MLQDLDLGRPLGSETKEPQVIGDVLNEMLQSNEPLAVGYRKWKAANEEENSVETGWNRNTDLCVDVKTYLRKDRVTQIGKDYPGVLTRDMEDHYQFIETLPSTAGKRNPHVFSGEFITITRRDDGSLRPNFKPMKVDENFTIDSYAIGVMNELRDALKGLVEEGGSK